MKYCIITWNIVSTDTFLYQFSTIIILITRPFHILHAYKLLSTSKWCLCIHFPPTLPGILRPFTQRLPPLISVNINKHREALSWVHGLHSLILKPDCANNSLTLSSWTSLATWTILNHVSLAYFFFSDLLATLYCYFTGARGQCTLAGTGRIL